MERDLKQKRLLIEDYQKKIKQAHESGAAKEIRIVNITLIFAICSHCYSHLVE